MLDLTRRKFIVGLGLIGIAPAIVKASSIMRIHEPKIEIVEVENDLWLPYTGFAPTYSMLPGAINYADLAVVQNGVMVAHFSDLLKPVPLAVIKSARRWADVIDKSSPASIAY